MIKYCHVSKLKVNALVSMRQTFELDNFYLRAQLNKLSMQIITHVIWHKLYADFNNQLSQEKLRIINQKIINTSSPVSRN